MQKKPKSEYFLRIFLRACECGPSTDGQTQATRLRANTGKQNASRKTHRLSATSSSANTLPPAYFLIQRTKTSDLQQLPLRRLRRRSLPHGSYLMVAHYKQLLTYNHIVGICITFPALLRSGSSSAPFSCILQSKNASASVSSSSVSGSSPLNIVTISFNFSFGTPTYVSP